MDSEELAARLDAGGWQVSTDADGADVVLVNTCGFVEKAKQDSIETLLAAADTGAKVVAAGCMAERYGKELARAMPEVDVVLSFDDYPFIGSRLDELLTGRQTEASPPHPPSRYRLGKGPVAALTLASGCDRRCSFCPIPSFRGGFVSRRPDEILAEAGWLAGQGVREVILASEDSTAYGKDSVIPDCWRSCCHAWQPLLTGFGSTTFSHSTFG